ncbi:DUF928 domain-containing protein [Vacuolonema iberomarrocanum]|uniref:DUF928 domain-containing protein n=1 Tax=Vacuolonema iberomarrocanum TaxID=3454632 RepID=UPI001A040F50|nr:DUF928 domain-containing protein [filamentous cyanobacterium LEGE 07170]
MKLSMLHTRRVITSLSLLVGASLIGLSTSVLAQYTPPDRGLPGRREGGGTRGGTEACVVGDRSMVALIPETVFGTTVKEDPTLYWYVPAVNAVALEFLLYDEAGNEVFAQTLPPTSEAGIVSIKVPTTGEGEQATSRLDVNEDYHWFFSIVCNESDRSADVFAEGWVRRIPLTDPLDGQLQAVPPTQQAEVFADAGIWYDALDANVQVRCEAPDDASLTNQWVDLLGSVGLEAVADASFTSACTAN